LTSFIAASPAKYAIDQSADGTIARAGWSASSYLPLGNTSLDRFKRRNSAAVVSAKGSPWLPAFLPELARSRKSPLGRFEVTSGRSHGRFVQATQTSSRAFEAAVGVAIGECPSESRQLPVGFQSTEPGLRLHHAGGGQAV
jgi:hypothetical protein